MKTIEIPEMTDEERLLNAGWSPNSLRLALDDLDSPFAANRESEKCYKLDTTVDRLALKRSPIVHVGTPKSSGNREAKVVDLKETPISYNKGQTIDLSISTTKKFCKLEVTFDSTLSCHYSNDDDDDDDITILSKNFRRQSIERGHDINALKNRKKASIASSRIIAERQEKSLYLAFDLAHTSSPVTIKKRYSSEQTYKNISNLHLSSKEDPTKNNSIAGRNDYGNQVGTDDNNNNHTKDRRQNVINMSGSGIENNILNTVKFDSISNICNAPISEKSIDHTTINKIVCKIDDLQNINVGDKIEKINKIENVLPIESQIEKMIIKANLDEILPNGWKLFQHQKDAIIDCIKLGRSIMAFDMGLGKTLISLIWAKSVCSFFNDCITLIIVPCTLIEIWKREAKMLGFDVIESISKHKMMNDNDSDNDNNTNNNNKNKMKNMLEKKFKPKISIHSWAKIPILTDINVKYVLIADEAHAMQSILSIRTKNILLLCLHKNCYGVILSTGTPMKNGRPSNILPLLIGIRHPIAYNKIEFEKKYCNAKKTKFCVWDTSGASNLEELRTAIGPYLLRKTKVRS